MLSIIKHICSVSIYFTLIFLLLHITAIFRSTNGKKFTKAAKADVDASCCSQHSISSKTGELVGERPFYKDGKCATAIIGEEPPHSLQGWIDYTVEKDYTGVCIDAFLYTAKGILFTLKYI